MRKIIITFQIFLASYLMVPISSFGQPGSLIRDFAIFGAWTDPDQSSAYRSIGIQPNGKIVVQKDARIGRFNTNGTLDGGFGDNGWKSVGPTPVAMAIQPDGKILTLVANNVRRFTVDGAVDTSFGVNGIATIEAFGLELHFSSMVMDSKNRIVVAGTAKFGTEPNTTTTIAFARLNPDGSLDTQLSGGGIRTQLFSDDDSRSVRGCGVDGDDNIILGIKRGSNFDNDDFITKYNEDGSLDVQFGDGDGIIAIGRDLEALAISRTGMIAYSTSQKFVAGQAQAPLIGRITEDEVNTTLGSMNVERITAVEIQDDGKIIAAGSNDPGGGVNGLFIRRFNANGSTDLSFSDEGGMVYTDLTFDIRALDVHFFNRRIYIAGQLIRHENLLLGIRDYYGLLLAYDGTNARLDCPSTPPSYNTDPGKCYATVNNINGIFSTTTLYANMKHKLEYNGTIEEGEGSVSGRQFPIGTTKVTYSYTDVTEQTCSFDIVVADKTPPTITCPLDQIVNADPGKCYATIAANKLGLAHSTDCSSVQVTGPAMPADNEFPIGVTNLTWTAKDEAGNTATCVQTITVVDNELPTISMSPKNVSTDPGQCHAVLNVADLGVPVVADNCLELSITEPAMPLNNIFPKGTTQLTWQVTDGSGNIGTAVQIVTVSDEELPKIENLSATPDVLSPPNLKMRDVTINYTTSDNCGIASSVISNITSSESADVKGGKSDAPDWEYVDNHHVRLRAKSTTGKGRIYTITITCTDVSGNIIQRALNIAVDAGSKPGATARMGADGETYSEEEKADRFDVQTYPNPSRSDFAIEIISEDNAPAELRVVDNVGHIIEHITATEKTLRMGMEWKSGMYIVDVVQGLKRKTIKLIKY